MTFLLTWQRAAGWLLSFFCAILRAHLKITQQQAIFFKRRCDEKMIPPHWRYSLYKTKEFGFSFWRCCEMKCETRRICAVELYVYSEISQSPFSSVAHSKKQDPGRASLITHVQAPCWHEKHFCKSHQITVFKVLHVCLFFPPLHEIINEPKTGTATVNYSDSIDEGMSHQFTTFFYSVHINRQKKRGKKQCFTRSHYSLKRKRETVSNRDWQTAISCSIDPRTQLS